MTDIKPAADEDLKCMEDTAMQRPSWANGAILSLIARIRAETAKNSVDVAAATDGKQVVTMAAEGAWQAAMVNEEALDKAAREGYAVRCKTHGPRTLAKYASDDIMKRQLDDARVIIEAYLSASQANNEGRAWDGNSIEALIDQYANGIYIGKISKPPLSVCVEHLREFATKLLALTPANSLATDERVKELEDACARITELYQGAKKELGQVLDNFRSLATPANSRAESLEDALKNLMGIYDTPLSRRRFPQDDFMKEAIADARAVLATPAPANSRAEAIGAFKAFYRGLEKAPADMPITAGSSMAKRQLTVGDLRALLQQEGE